ncbi:hypothetical protein DPMN_006052 [Dreissena polymorpha]|uniref:Uncharacterized protein n=1 Tax=Dreissena polymorpha TaxID=45954 RepID=A0A9D4RUH9_DREPO|nr:hypothetical protein DPMN_006052 [Dreissena polymorpha]
MADLNPLGTPMSEGTNSLSRRGEQILQDLQSNMEKFASIAKSVADMNKTIISLKNDVNSLKRKREEENSDELSDQSQGPSDQHQIDQGPTNPKKIMSVATISDSDSDTEDDLDRFLENCQDDSTQSDKEGDDFWEDLDDFCAEMNDTGDPVSDKIAEVCNKSIKIKASDEKIKEIKSRNKRPKNVEYLQIPRVEEFLWRQLRSSTRANDFMLQKNHGTLAQAAVPIVKALDHLQQSASKDKVLKGHISDAFKLLTNGIAQNVAVRREKIKRDMQPKYKHLGNLEPSAEKLFDKIQENLKSCESTKLIVNVKNNAGTNKKPFLGQWNKMPNNQKWDHRGGYPQKRQGQHQQQGQHQYGRKFQYKPQQKTNKK